MSGPPEHTSATQLNTYASCPRRYAYRYVERREPEVRGVGMALGSAVHSSLEWWLEQRASAQAPELDELFAVLGADLSAATAHENIVWGTATPASLIVEAQRLVRAFIATRGDIDVAATEVPFELPIVDPITGAQMPRRLVGYFDMELVDGTIVELKTAKRAFSAVELRAGLQFSAYRTAARYRGVDVEVCTLVRTKTPTLHTTVLPHDRNVSRWFMDAAAGIERAILAGLFPPAPGRTCSFCEFRRACLGVEAREEEVADAEAA